MLYILTAFIIFIKINEKNKSKIISNWKRISFLSCLFDRENVFRNIFKILTANLGFLFISCLKVKFKAIDMHVFQKSLSNTQHDHTFISTSHHLTDFKNCRSNGKTKLTTILRSCI